MSANGSRISVNKLLDLLLSQCQDHDGSGLIKEMDAAGISKSIVLLPDFTYIFASDISISEMYDQHQAFLKKHQDRVAVFAGIDPRWGKDGLDLFEKGVKEYGFSGLKLYPPCGYSPSDKILYPFYEICRAHQIPVLLHTGPTSPVLEHHWAEAKLIDTAAHLFPEVNFILAHGGVHDVEKCVSLCAYRPNLYLDIGAFASLIGPTGWQGKMAHLFSQGINHKIIFGTDWPVVRPPGGQASIIREFCAENGPLNGISLKQKELILRGNISRLLK
jgi:predicted TIM-barrel fold metal-dependent hydrolase